MNPVVVVGSYVQHHTNPPSGCRGSSRSSPPRLWCACWSSHGGDHDTKPHRNGGHPSACCPQPAVSSSAVHGASCFPRPACSRRRRGQRAPPATSSSSCVLAPELLSNISTTASQGPTLGRARGDDSRERRRYQQEGKDQRIKMRSALAGSDGTGRAQTVIWGARSYVCHVVDNLHIGRNALPQPSTPCGAGRPLRRGPSCRGGPAARHCVRMSRSSARRCTAVVGVHGGLGLDAGSLRSTLQWARGAGRLAPPWSDQAGVLPRARSQAGRRRAVTWSGTLMWVGRSGAGIGGSVTVRRGRTPAQ